MWGTFSWKVFTMLWEVAPLSGFPVFFFPISWSNYLCYYPFAQAQWEHIHRVGTDQCVWVWRREEDRKSEKQQKRSDKRKLLIILICIRRNMSSQYPWRRVMNASYCSLDDIRSSSPPALSQLSSSFSLLVYPSLCHMYVFLFSFIKSILAVTCTSHLLPSYLPDFLSPSVCGIFFAYFWLAFPPVPHVLSPNLFTVISHLCCAASYLRFPLLVCLIVIFFKTIVPPPSISHQHLLLLYTAESSVKVTHWYCLHFYIHTSVCDSAFEEIIWKLTACIISAFICTRSAYAPPTIQ